MAHKESEVNKTVSNIFLDWVNNYLSIKGFSEANDMTIDEAKSLLKIGKALHERYVEEIVESEGL